MRDLINAHFMLFFVALTFMAVLLLLAGAYLLWDARFGPRARKISARLKTLSGHAEQGKSVFILKNRLSSNASTILQWLAQVPLVHLLDRFLLQSGLDWSVTTLLGLSVFSALNTALVLVLFHAPAFIELSVVATAACLPLAYLCWKRKARLAIIEQQLPEALDLIARALRSGHAVPLGLQLVGEEMKGPIAREFNTAFEEINFGGSLQEGLNNLGQRVPLTDVRYFIIAVLIQRETGGNLAELLNNLSKLIRERFKFRSRVRVLSVEGRLSAWILGLLPFLLAGMMSLVNHDFISVMWNDPVGITLTKSMFVIMVIGAVWLHRLLQLRF